jgi:hypothetical protein
VEATWPPALVDEVAATGAVDMIDFKGPYGLEVKDPRRSVRCRTAFCRPFRTPRYVRDAPRWASPMRAAPWVDTLTPPVWSGVGSD